jgi:hypothetical protein
MSDYHFILTLQFEETTERQVGNRAGVGSRRQLTTSNGTVTWQPGQTRKELYDAIFAWALDRNRKDNTQPIMTRPQVLFFSLEPNTLPAPVRDNSAGGPP